MNGLPDREPPLETVKRILNEVITILQQHPEIQNIDTIIQYLRRLLEYIDDEENGPPLIPYR